MTQHNTNPFDNAIIAHAQRRDAANEQALAALLGIEREVARLRELLASGNYQDASRSLLDDHANDLACAIADASHAQANIRGLEQIAERFAESADTSSK